MSEETPIPQALIERRQWITWRNIDGRKIPFQVDGRPASSTDPATWSTYADAKAIADHIPASEGGLGFVFTQDDPFIGIDLDGCVDHSGKVEDWAVEVLLQLRSYCEISPSGTGVKIFALGSLPDGRGRKTTVFNAAQVSAKIPSIEIYDRGRYFAVTGETCWWREQANDAQEAIDAILATHFPAAVQKASTYAAPAPDREALVERARLYMQTVDAAVSGANGHNTTFRAACVLILGFGLTPEESLPLMAEYNGRCEPPWTEKELIHKIESANKMPGDRGYLIGEALDHAASAAWMENLANNWFAQPEAIHVAAPEVDVEDEVEELLIPVPKSPVFPTECLRPPGFLSEVIAWNLETALYPMPRLALSGALALLSVLTGRKLTDRYGTRTNIYSLALAPSGTGKEHARKVNKKILAAAGASNMLGPERIGSHAGLIAWVAKHESLLFQLDEIGRLFATMKSAAKSPHLYNIASVLMSMYSASDQTWIGDAYADADKTPRIDQPCAVVYGTTTPGDFFSNMTAENVSDGFLGRFLAFEDEGGELNEELEAEASVPPHITKGAQRWFEMITRPGNLAGTLNRPLVVTHSPEARQRFELHMKAIRMRQREDEDTTGALWARSGGKAGKLALLFAASRCTHIPEVSVELQDVDLAIKLSNYLTRRMIYNVFEMVSENEIVAKKKRILRLMGDRPVTGADLARKTQFLGRRERDELVTDLVACGLVTVATEQTGGRPRMTYRRALAQADA